MRNLGVIHSQSLLYARSHCQTQGGGIMTFKAHYMSASKPDYWRTIYADTLNSASRQAERFAKKTYTVRKITQWL